MLQASCVRKSSTSVPKTSTHASTTRSASWRQRATSKSEAEFSSTAGGGDLPFMCPASLALLASQPCSGFKGHSHCCQRHICLNRAWKFFTAIKNNLKKYSRLFHDSRKSWAELSILRICKIVWRTNLGKFVVLTRYIATWKYLVGKAVELVLEKLKRNSPGSGM